MKTNLLILFIALTGWGLSQANTCETANAFCSSQNYTFPNATGTTAPNGPNYGCLISQPNPIWYYMEIGTSGTLQLQVSQTGASPLPFFPPGPTDVDFAMWGPFTSVAAGCAMIMSGSTPPIQCSYSSDPSETIGIGLPGGYMSGASTPPAAVAGEIYIVLLTNYEDTNGEITFSQTSGTATTDCSIVEPDICSIDDLTATVSACSPATSLYSVSGTVTISNPPASGQLIVETCDGIQTVAASAPFNAGSYPYNITGLNPDGAGCSVYAYFSGEPACSQILNYTAPVCQDPTACLVSHIEANIGSCEEGSIFQLTGFVEFQNAPATGQLIVEDCNGNSVSLNPPFISPLSFHIPNVNADGQNCEVTTYFTAEPGCTLSVDYVNTFPCECTVDIGTFTTTTSGASNSTYVLCYGDEITIDPNGDYIPPPIALHPPYQEGYEPGISWMVYSCPPTVATTPNLFESIPDDPCFIGIAAMEDFYDSNDLSWMTDFPGVFTNNTVYFVPLTMYNLTTAHYSYTNQDMPCYELGTPFPIQYLPEVTGTAVSDCEEGTLSITVQGGSAEVNGTNFTASVVTPSHATVTTNNVPNGGTIVISGLQYGDSYSILIEDEFGCPISFSGTFEEEEAAVITYPKPAYCKNNSNPLPTITGSTGGTFSGSAGLVINPSSGLIDLTATPAGNYTVTYTLPETGGCSSPATFDITINEIPVVEAIGDTICAGEVAFLTASGADTYSWSPSAGLDVSTGSSVQVVLTSGQTYTVTGTDSSTGCMSTAQAVVHVDVAPNVHFSANPQVGTQFNSQITFINNTQGADSYIWDFGDDKGSSTASNPVYTYSETPDSYIVTLIAVSEAGCVDTASLIVVIREELIFYVPNTFTPDQDEFNQVFKPVFTSGYDPYDYSLQVFNRWGELIFESHNPEIGWTGTYGVNGVNCQGGTYTWKIEVKTVMSDERKMFVGHINLIR